MVGGVAASLSVTNREFATTNLLGVELARVDYERAVRFVLAAAGRRESRTVSALAVHGVMTGALDVEHRTRLNAFDMLTPDGQPVRWAMNWLEGGKRERLSTRVSGPELTRRLCEAAAREGVAVYLYGSRPEVVEALARNLGAAYPNLKIVGAQPSRFREATPEEDTADVERINRSGAGIVFVGLGCPRQERWAWAHKDRIRGVTVCVGAAFDFHAGMLRRAPEWMGQVGLEWVFRLVMEPRRLWKRYLLLNPLYLALVGLQRCRLLRPNRGPAGSAGGGTP